MAPRVVLVDRPSRAAQRLLDLLVAEGFVVHAHAGVEEALAAWPAAPDAVLAAAPSCTPELFARLALGRPPASLLALADFASESSRDELLRAGAEEVLVRPLEDAAVLEALRRALASRALRLENERLRAELGERFTLGGLVSRDPRMQRVFHTLQAVLDSRVGILILGESGTGKTVLARAVHEGSERRAGPFVVVNCGALPATLLESELFGHARGAFTGAVRERIGKFESAHGGTLFLDEVGTAPPELQVKLLRVIEEGRFERVGEARTRQVDVRLIAATNVDLAAEVGAGRFRADLYYRLHVVGVELPPLRERPVDVPLLAARFLQRFAREHRRAIEGFEPAALALLCAHAWPGNVRELENTVERAVLLAGGPSIAARDLWPDRGAGAEPSAPPPVAPEAAPVAPEGSPPALETLPLGPLKDVLAVPERWLILRALRHHGGNRQETAKSLGINRTTLFNKMRKHDLSSFPTQAEASGEPPPDGDHLREAG